MSDEQCTERCLGVIGHAGPHQTSDYVRPITLPDRATLTDWLIEDVTAERATREGNPENRESFLFVAKRLLRRLKETSDAP